MDEVFGYALSREFGEDNEMGRLRPRADAPALLTCGPSTTAGRQVHKPGVELTFPLRSTFGFIDTKGKPNESGFCFSVVMGKPTLYSDLSRQARRHPPTGCPTAGRGKAQLDQGPVGACSDLCKSGGPVPKEEQGHIGLLCPWKF